MSHVISPKGRIYEDSSPGTVLGSVSTTTGRIYKGSSPGTALPITKSEIHSKIKNSKNYDLALMAAVYHFLIKPIF